MRILRLSCGLGNTMFQYATYLQLKKMYPSEDVYFDTLFYKITEYPFELDKIFNIDIKTRDAYELFVKNRMNELCDLNKLRFWRAAGYDSYSAMTHAYDLGNLSYEEYAEVYRRVFPELEINSQLTETFGELLEKITQPDDCILDYWHRDSIKRNVYRKMCSLMWPKKEASTTYVCAMKLLNEGSRKKFWNDLRHFRRPDFANVSSLGRLQKKTENVYYNIYGEYCDVLGVEEELKKAFKFISFSENEHENIEMAKQIISENAVAIHARIGHYEYGMSDIVKRGYYKRAVKYIKKKGGKNQKYYVFSDHPDWCKEHNEVFGLDTNDCVQYVDWNRGDKSFRDMHLMSLCKHIVIPNSTFSWWAGYLIDNPNKCFVTPYGTFPGTISM